MNIVKYYNILKEHSSKIILYADLLLKKHFLLLSMLKTVVLLNMFV